MNDNLIHLLVMSTGVIMEMSIRTIRNIIDQMPNVNRSQSKNYHNYLYICSRIFNVNFSF